MLHKIYDAIVGFRTDLGPNLHEPIVNEVRALKTAVCGPEPQQHETFGQGLRTVASLLREILTELQSVTTEIRELVKAIGGLSVLLKALLEEQRQAPPSAFSRHH